MSESGLLSLMALVLAIFLALVWVLSNEPEPEEQEHHREDQS